MTITNDGGRRGDPVALLHPWPAEKRGGSDLDRCPECRETTYVRRMKWDGSRWHRPTPASATCSNCGTTWELAPIAGGGRRAAEPISDQTPEEPSSDRSRSCGSTTTTSEAGADGRPLRLAIVGSRSLAGNVAAERVVREVLDAYQARHPDLVVVSGGARGIDRMAAAEARHRGLAVVEHLPARFDWRGFRERDQRIAEDCDELVRVADPGSRTYGSGWTRDRARELGKPTAEYRVGSAEHLPSRVDAEAER